MCVKCAEKLDFLAQLYVNPNFTMYYKSELGGKLHILSIKRKWQQLYNGSIANFCSLPSMSFGQALGKLQGKVVTNSE